MAIVKASLTINEVGGNTFENDPVDNGWKYLFTIDLSSIDSNDDDAYWSTDDIFYWYLEEDYDDVNFKFVEDTEPYAWNLNNSDNHLLVFKKKNDVRFAVASQEGAVAYDEYQS